MGAGLSTLFFKYGILHMPQMRVVMIGLDNAGKTSILYKLVLGEIGTVLPTIGFNRETIEYNNMIWDIWDLGHPPRVYALWKHCFPGSNAVIYVVDSNDQERLREAKEELHEMLTEEDLRHAPLLVIANKQDLPQAPSVAELTKELSLHSIKNRRWHIQGTSATKGEGLHEGLRWLANTLR